MMALSGGQRGTVYIDGTEVGPAPLVSYPVTAGSHTLEIRPLQADEAMLAPYTVEFTIERLLEDRSLGRVQLPAR